MPKRKMSPEEKREYLDSLSFTNLVKAINKKWSHTYIDVLEQDYKEESSEK